MTRLFARLLIALCAISLWSGSGSAADNDPRADQTARSDPGWHFQLSPYLWAASMDGKVAPFSGLPTLHIEKSFSDILHDLNFGGFVNFFARNDRFVFNADLMYVNTTDSKSTHSLPVPGPLTADVDTVEFTSTLQVGYRVHNDQRFAFDLLVGTRIWYISNEVDVRFAGLSLSHKESFSWMDPVVAARLLVRVSDRLSFLVHSDIGGFGTASDFTWQVLATINYNISERWTVSAGYKRLYVDYDKDGHVFNTTLSGAVLGLTFRF
jgi:hypothetical protein